MIGGEWDSSDSKRPQGSGVQGTKGVGYFDREAEGDGVSCGFQAWVQGWVFGGVWLVCLSRGWLWGVPAWGLTSHLWRPGALVGNGGVSYLLSLGQRGPRVP